MPDTAQRPFRPEDGSLDAFAVALGELLIRQKQVDDKGLDRARRLAKENGARLDQVLTQLGLVSERDLADGMAGVLGLAVAASADYPSVAVLPDRLRLKFLRKARALPLSVDDHAIVVAMADPLDGFTRAAIAAATGRSVKTLIAIPIDLESAFDRLYAEHEQAGSLDAVELMASVEASSDDDAERLKDLASEEPLIRLVNQLIARAVETRASDIHIEPFEDRVRVRYRYDGVLHEVDTPPRHLQPAIVSRIKIMAMLDIAERRLPQDGRIRLVVRGQEIDLRVSTMPALHGESVVLRILDRSAVDLDFDKLGLGGDLRGDLCRLLELPNGIILVTGPTGSGKTTTLYSGLLHLNSIERNIVTVEDPIEYQLFGITQIQVKPQIGLNFASLLRAILRHDPDVIMIGEIRDIETAQIAVQAALTGHLVLSTLHTNSAAATISRLRDMGLEDYLMAATLNGVLAQRLLRRLCPDCKRPMRPAPGLLTQYGLDRFAGSGDLVLFEPAGCAACRGTGYVGRIAVAELLPAHEAIRQLVLAHADYSAIQGAACAAGMQTMYESGLACVAEGATSLGELLRTIRLDG